MRELANIAADVAAETDDGPVGATPYRDASGIGRNLTVELLEFFDGTGFTQRRGNARRIVRPAREVDVPVGA